MSCLEECVLSADDTLGYGVRQILGANPKTSKKQADNYMDKVSDVAGGRVTVVNFVRVLDAMDSGELKVGGWPSRVHKSCIALYEFCRDHNGSISMAELKKGKVYGVGPWSIMWMARCRCGGKCWVPGDSAVYKKMIKAGVTNIDDKHDDIAVEMWGNTSLSKSNLNRYFTPEMDKNFSRFNKTVAK